MSSQRKTAAQIEERRSQVWELHLIGVSDREIGRLLDMHHTTVARDVTARLDALVQSDIANGERVRALNAARYARLLQNQWPLALTGNDPAMGRVLQIMSRLDEIFGLRKLAEVNLLYQQNVLNTPNQVRLIVTYDDPPAELGQVVDSRPPESGNGHRHREEM